MRKLLLDLIPDLVSTAETFSQHVTYIGVSATGGPPLLDQNTGEFGYISGKINPIWTEVPFFHAQTLAKKTCIPSLKDKKSVTSKR